MASRGSFTPRGAPRGGRGGFTPRGRGGFSPRGRGGGGGGYGGYQEGPPAEVVALGTFMHPCEEEMICKSIHEKVPYFNAPIYTENKTQIGKLDEIFGPINGVMFTVKCDPGVKASSFKADDKVYISTEKLLPMARFLPAPPGTKGPSRGGAGGARGGFTPRGRGGFAPRGGARGGFSPRGGAGFASRGGGGFASRGAPRGGGFTPRGRGRGGY